MAELIPFGVMENVLMNLGSSAIQRIGSMYGVPMELAKLEETLATIRAVLVDAEDLPETTAAVEVWVRRLKRVVYDADDMLDDFVTHQLQLQRGGVARQVSHFFSSSNQLSFRYKMSQRVKDMKKSLDEINKDIPLLNIVVPRKTSRHPGAMNVGRETHSFVLPSETVGRDENKEEIVEFLLSPHNQKNLSIVAVIGIGGLGKTTLAQLVFNDEKMKMYFEPMMWICVSDDFDVKLLAKKILKSMNRTEQVDNLELDVLKNMLHQKLSQKRYLLVLDDVWEESFQNWDQLNSLLTAAGGIGSKILATTRNDKVALAMKTDRSFDLKCLDENQSWELFSKLAYIEGPEKANQKLVVIGKEIAKMCKGVPLVIKTLGSVLRFKSEEWQWSSIKENKNLLSLGDGNDNVLRVLKLSFDNLPTHLKQCFAYCALFPKDYEIEKKMLVQLWMAQGYIQPSNEDQQLEDVGDLYFKELLSRSLFLEVKNNVSTCQIHDLIHDLAQSIASQEVFIIKDDTKNISKTVHHISTFGPLSPVTEALKEKPIRTLLSLNKDNFEDDSFKNKLISSFKCLRALSLRGFKVRKVPKYLGKLSHLRYLDLSFCQFKVLPNCITKLKNLQTLKLIDCENLKEFDSYAMRNRRVEFASKPTTICHWEEERLVIKDG